MKEGGPWQKLLASPRFADMIISIIFDEGRCISTWADFRTDYRAVGLLHLLLPPRTPVLVADATFPPNVFEDVKEILHFRKSELVVFRTSCDRPDISILVRPICSPLSSFTDLDFVIQSWKDDGTPPPKFLVFFDSISESVKAANYLKSLLPMDLRNKINWFHSQMSNTFKTEELDRFTKGDTWGLFATDSFGMVSWAFVNMFTPSPK
jgi:superfamily II DNA helicase RecQ